MQKSLDERIKECKMVYAQNIESTITGDMVYKYLKDSKTLYHVKSHIVNPRGGLVKLEFDDHEKAKQYYERANFQEKILMRPLNLYLNLQLNENQVKKFYLEGLKEENLRELFHHAKKIGMCKIYASYAKSSLKGKMKSTGILSFIKNEQIAEEDFKYLQTQLKEIGISICPYRLDKGLKFSLQITEFYQARNDEQENQIKERAKNKLEQILKRTTKNFDQIQRISINLKKKDEEDREVIKVKGFAEFKTSEKAIEIFEQIRKGFLDEANAKVMLNFHNSEHNSYTSLFTSGLENKQKLNDKQFEDKLVRDFRKINPGVVQVNVYPIERNQTYVGRVYLKNEDAGKDFIVDYPQKREYLIEHYKDAQSVRFNINVDEKTMKRIKAMEKAANKISHQIKNDQNTKKEKKYGYMPDGTFKPKPLQVPPSHPLGSVTLPPMSNKLPAFGNLGNMPFMGMGTSAFMPTNKKEQGISHTEKMIEKMIKDKEQLVKLSKNSAQSDKNIRNGLVKHIKLLLQHKCNINPQNIGLITDKILTKNDIAKLIDFLADPKNLYRQVYDGNLA